MPSRFEQNAFKVFEDLMKGINVDMLKPVFKTNVIDQLKDSVNVIEKDYEDINKSEDIEDIREFFQENERELIKEELHKGGHADSIYELTGKVVCRCLTQGVIKIVSDQWFIDYKNPEWKKKTHECLRRMKIYPEKARQQFAYTIDWLRQWACTHEEGLGTRLPWDNKWLIESLSKL